MKNFVIIIGAVLTLSACGNEPANDTQNGNAQTAEGKVLGGTISDEMLPLGTVTSQPPPLREARDTDAPENMSNIPDDSGSAEAEPNEDTATPPPEQGPTTENPSEEG